MYEIVTACKIRIRNDPIEAAVYNYTKLKCQ